MNRINRVSDWCTAIPVIFDNRKKTGSYETLDRFGAKLLMVRDLEVSFTKPRSDFTKPMRLRNFLEVPLVCAIL